MAAKKTVFLNKPGRVREIRQTDIDDLKKAFGIMVDDYIRMKAQQSKFEDSLERVCLKISPWTIPRKRVQRWLHEFHRTATVSRGRG